MHVSIIFLNYFSSFECAETELLQLNIPRNPTCRPTRTLSLHYSSLLHIQHYYYLKLASWYTYDTTHTYTHLEAGNTQSY